MKNIRLIPRKIPAPRSQWRPIAERMVAEELTAVVDSLAEAQALGIALRRLGKAPVRRKLDGEGWELSFRVTAQKSESESPSRRDR